MAVAAMMNLEKRLLFLYYLTNHRQMWWAYCYFDSEHIDDVEQSILFIYLYINHLQQNIKHIL